MAQTSIRVRPVVIMLLGVVIVALFWAARPVVAQEPLSASTVPRGHLTELGHEGANGSPAIEANAPPPVSNDRLLFALPNFMTVESTGKLQPLTARQKFKLVARSTFDPVDFPLYGLRAGLIQAQDRPSSYEQDLSGYGKRYALTFADCTVENFMAGAVLPSLLQQDPRYYRMAHGLKRLRFRYAVSRIFITRTDSGAEQFNYSEIVGSAAAASISAYSYHPHEEHSLGGVASTWGSQLAFHTFMLVMREFWPDIRREVFHTR
jgi:hypothetical protein